MVFAGFDLTFHITGKMKCSVTFPVTHYTAKWTGRAMDNLRNALYTLPILRAKKDGEPWQPV